VDVTSVDRENGEGLNSTSALFYPPPKDYSKCCGQIFVKLGRWMRCGPGKNRLVLGTDLDVDQFLYYWYRAPKVWSGASLFPG